MNLTLLTFKTCVSLGSHKVTTNTMSQWRQEQSLSQQCCFSGGNDFAEVQTFILRTLIILEHELSKYLYKINDYPILL